VEPHDLQMIIKDNPATCSSLDNYAFWSEEIPLHSGMQSIDLQPHIPHHMFARQYEVWFQVCDATTRQPLVLADLWQQAWLSMNNQPFHSDVMRLQLWPLSLKRGLCPYTWLYVLCPWQADPRVTQPWNAQRMDTFDLNLRWLTQKTALILRIGTVFRNQVK